MARTLKNTGLTAEELKSGAGVRSAPTSFARPAGSSSLHNN
jgi:hypothetical protein